MQSNDNKKASHAAMLEKANSGMNTRLHLNVLDGRLSLLRCTIVCGEHLDG
jgi:hypothetical protein